MEKYKVAIVIPAFNEGATVFNVVKSTKRHGTVIVVDDASKDDTASKARKAGAIVVSHEINQGYDGALNSGFYKANELGCEIIITFDADGQHDPDLIEKYIFLIETGSDVVIGIRDKFQRVGEYIFSKIAKLKWGIVDPLCGMKAYRVDVFNQLGYFDSYSSIGTELAIYAAHENIKIAQHPIKIKDRQDKPRFGNMFSANINILRSLWLGYRKY
jgi:glycosyltransferase involved in cell wall biosynthesis